MSDLTPRAFRITIAALLRQGQLIANGLADPLGAPVVARFTTFNVAERYANLRQNLENGGLSKTSAVGGLGELTREKAQAFTEMERLMSSARRLAARLFRDNAPRLHTEFCIGDDGPDDLASEVARGRTIAASCRTHADALAEKGWTAQDTKDLTEAVQALGGTDGKKELTRQESRQLTNARNLAANAYYDLTLDIIEAARRAYPSTRAEDENVIKARGLFLVDTFSPNPRRGSSGSAEPEPPATPPAPPAAEPPTPPPAA